MAQPTNTFSSYDAVGNREDLTNIIYDVTPTDTPVMSALPRVKATAVKHEWQTDSLAAASAANAVIEGDDATTDASTATTRLDNRCQIMDKVAQVTGTQEAVSKAGRKSEMAYQMEKRMKELKRDIEAAICDNGAYVAGNDTTARELAGIPAWLTTNTSFGATGADPVTIGSTARTDGTQRAFTEDLLKAVLQDCFTNGGNPTMAVVGAFNKRKASEFTGSATRMDKSEDKKLYAAIDVYVSDFGEIKFVPDRFSRARDCLLIDPEYAALAYLRPFETVDLAKTGDTTRKQILVELTLEMRNEAAHGGVFDLTTS